MKLKFLNAITLLCLIPLMSCAQSKAPIENTTKKQKTKQQEPHRYGGWYCPDNLTNLPPVDIKDWASVPVVNGRMATKEECRNGSSLIHVDMVKYPNAKVLDISMPKLARFYCHSSGKEELIIVIQAINITNDSILGFRYLNGGNGSARMSEVNFLSENEIANIVPSRFVTLNVNINATSDQIWQVLTKAKHNKVLANIYDKENTLKTDWHKQSKVNYKYLNDLKLTSAFGGDLFGNKYIQIDFKKGDYNYAEKFFLSENKALHNMDLQIVCGPYRDDYESQKAILKSWAQKVKVLSEGLK